MMLRGFALLTLGVCAGMVLQNYYPVEFPLSLPLQAKQTLHIGSDIPAGRMVHRSYHEYTLPPNTCGITVEIRSGGAAGSSDVPDAAWLDKTMDVQRCLTVKGEKGVNGGGDGGDAIFCGDSVAILPGHGGDGNPPKP